MKPTWQMNPTELRAHHAAQVEENLRMLETAQLSEPEQARRQRALIGTRSAEGDERRLRGIPCIARGVGGAIPGSSPHSVR